MRLFVALPPPAPAVAQLWAATAALRAAHPGWGWARPEQWHLTLAFLGEVADPADVSTRLARAAHRSAPLALAVAGAGRFGDRVLWARVDGDRAGLGRLAASVRAAARRAGIAVDTRPYRPHLTLARVRGGADLRPAVAALAGFVGSSWTADALHLVRSTLGAGPGGTAAHTPYATYPLGRIAAG